MTTTFTSITREVRLHAGADALTRLPREMQRLGARRALVVCGNSVATRTSLIEHIVNLSGDKVVGVFSGIRKDAPLEDVLACAEKVQRKHADLLIGVGAGSVLKAARVVAIFVAEPAPLEDLVTQFEVDGRPVS